MPINPTIATPTAIASQSATTFKAGDTLPVLIATLQDAAGAPINLTGAVVRFRMSSRLDAAPKVDALAVIDVDPTSGRVSYAWVSGDLDTAQDWRGEFHVTFTAGGTITVPDAAYLPITVLPLA